jgi:CheY-like chemotaxis protein
LFIKTWYLETLYLTLRTLKPHTPFKTEMLDNKINLLVIDDDEINIFIIKKIVEKTGFDIEMTTKSNGQQGIDFLKHNITNLKPLPHLILIDINMPIMNGWEFVETYCTLGIDQKVDLYILSSSVYENDIEKTKSYPWLKGFISKPLSVDRLSGLLNSI